MITYGENVGFLGNFGNLNNVLNTVRSLKCNLFYKDKHPCYNILNPQIRNSSNKQTRVAQTKQCRNGFFRFYDDNIWEKCMFFW